MKLEIGKYYENRRGEVRGPIGHSGLVNRFYDGERHYTMVGIYTMVGGKHEPDLDLIAEVVHEDRDFIAAAAACNHVQPEVYIDYQPLQDVLNEAFAQSAGGKGKERHANGRDFKRQPIMEIGRMVGIGYPTGQAQKKTQEAVGMLGRGQPDRAVAELLGAIVYLAAAVILIREG